MISSYVIGHISSVIGQSVSYPIDSIKTQRIVHPTISTKEVIVNTFKKEGLKGFYRGFIPVSLAYPVYWGVYFTIYDRRSNFRYTGNKHIDNTVHTLLSGSIASSVSNPLFIIKTRSQYNVINGYHQPYAAMIKDIYRTNGLSGFLKGYPATVLSTTKLMIQFPMYEYLREEKEYSIVSSSIVSKIIANTLFYPFEVARNIQRVSSAKINLFEVIASKFRAGGISGVSRGLVLYNLTSTTSFIVMMYSRELLSFL